MSSAPSDWHDIEIEQPFARSRLWALQRAYYEQRGADAWRSGQVPLYATCNPSMAAAYASIIVASLRDAAERGIGVQAQDLTVIELGAGSGRFTHLLLQALRRAWDEGAPAPRRLRYVMTDVAERNLEAWRTHPLLAPWFARGALDLARFDAEAPAPIMLRIARETLALTSELPAVVVANYVVDGLPADLYFVSAGVAAESCVSLRADADLDALDVAETIAHIQYRYTQRPAPHAPYPEPALNAVLEFYRGNLSEAYVLLPATATRCLSAMASWAAGGLVTLLADKGRTHLDAIEGQPAPILVHHGSFSIDINLHALGLACEHAGGDAMLTTRGRSVAVGCLLWGAAAGGCKRVRQAFGRAVEDFGPDDWLHLWRGLQPAIPSMALEDLAAILGLSQFDPHVLDAMLPRLHELAPTLGCGQRFVLETALARCWANHFPLGREEPDLAFELGTLLYQCRSYLAALDYFERSEALHGASVDGLHNMALCLRMLGRHDEEAQVVARLQELEPDYERIGELQPTA